MFTKIFFGRIEHEYIKIIENKPSASHLIDEAYTDSMEEHFLKLGNIIRTRSCTKYLAGVSLDYLTLIVWFNNQLYHAAPLSMNLLYNAILAAKIGENSGSIQVSNWPIPFRADPYASLATLGYDMGSQLALIMSFAMAFTMSFYSMFYIYESSSKAKLLQLLSGLNISTFWVTSFIFDLISHAITCAIFYVTLIIFKEEGWTETDEIMPAIIVLFVFGVAALAVTIVFSLLFTNPAYGFVSMSIFYVLTGQNFSSCLFFLKYTFI